MFENHFGFFKSKSSVYTFQINQRSKAFLNSPELHFWCIYICGQQFVFLHVTSYHWIWNKDLISTGSETRYSFWIWLCQLRKPARQFLLLLHFCPYNVTFYISSKSDLHALYLTQADSIGTQGTAATPFPPPHAYCTKLPWADVSWSKVWNGFEK